MNKDELTTAVDNTLELLATALTTIYNSLNQGQQKQLLKNPSVHSLYQLYAPEILE